MLHVRKASTLFVSLVLFIAAAMRQHNGGVEYLLSDDDMHLSSSRTGNPPWVMDGVVNKGKNPERVTLLEQLVQSMREHLTATWEKLKDPEEIEMSKLIQTWFGADPKLEIIKATVQGMLYAVNHIAFAGKAGGRCTDESFLGAESIAYVNSWTDKSGNNKLGLEMKKSPDGQYKFVINLCQSFWGSTWLNAVGMKLHWGKADWFDFRLDTLLHELSHHCLGGFDSAKPRMSPAHSSVMGYYNSNCRAGGTRDYNYETLISSHAKECLKLAKKDPAKAARNAENFARFIVSSLADLRKPHSQQEVHQEKRSKKLLNRLVQPKRNKPKRK